MSTAVLTKQGERTKSYPAFLESRMCFVLTSINITVNSPPGSTLLALVVAPVLLTLRVRVCLDGKLHELS